MLRFIVPSLTLALVLPLAANAASLQEFELGKLLKQVAEQSNVGTPREINENILDQGYTVEGNELVDHLSVMQGEAEKMRANPEAMRVQLGRSVCSNKGYRDLMAKGAAMRYEFTENKTNLAVTTQRYTEAHCKLLDGKAAKKK
ncbi:MAG: PA3611 family quorum-sensing-regulated virulence factor [Pseudomonas sp.]|uniref:PA3611 family quorum-sensing-regulated virulence factor n=1 Tax=Pseudomonas abieticivorans TaxID=2931382 RepID=UPI0020C11FF2|nr:PA3611 family quorum-sensing-regulated virulence factor [Pseudomonas sp. PIA16]MDE1165947.1 PA3611 family quorum-sensing-regulated virulence factor [Pseudomonas sp.]